MAFVGLLRQVAWVPSGPLGWVSARTLYPRLGGSVYRGMADALRLRADDELLDVACGSGTFLARHASQVRRVAGIDLSGVQITLARRGLRERIVAGTAEIVEGDAGALPWPDDSFTVVACMAAFETFPDPEQVLGEMFRVLRPGGRAAMSIGERVPAGTQTQRRWGALWIWAEDDVRTMVEQAGFTGVTVRYAAAWGDDPLSKLLARLVDRLGADTRALRIVTAVKE